jgi:hypothetical protein
MDAGAQSVLEPFKWLPRDAFGFRTPEADVLEQMVIERQQVAPFPPVIQVTFEAQDLSREKARPRGLLYMDARIGIELVRLHQHF